MPPWVVRGRLRLNDFSFVRLELRFSEGGVMDEPSIPDGIVEFMHELCDTAAEQTLSRFRSGLDVENKQSVGFDPVTLADRAAEAAIRTRVAQRFPDHGIIGEEDASHNAQAEFCWVIDPIDGTRAFIAGLPSWGTLIGLTRNGVPVAGIMDQPYIGERFFAADGEAWLQHGASRKRLKTANTPRLGDAILMTTSPHIFSADETEFYRALEKSCRLARYGFDCYAYAMVAAGHIDLVVESGLKIYDIAPLIPIIETAGGVVTNWRGGSAAKGGQVLAAANRQLHAEALQLLSEGQKVDDPGRNA